MNALQTSRPNGIRYTHMQRQLVNAVILLAHQLGSNNRYAGILNLMLARQLDFIIGMIKITCMQSKGLSLHRAFDLRTVKSLAVKINRRFLKHSQADNRTKSFIAFGSGNQRHLFLDNTGLLHSNALQRFATAVGMVQRNIGNNADHRCNHVSGIPQAAHAYLNNSVIHLLQVKIQKRCSCQNLKLRRLLADALFNNTVGSNLYRSNRRRKILVADILTVEVDALVVLHQMRRSKLAHLQVCCQQNIRNHAGNRAFAVSAGYMHCFNLLLRVSQLPQKSFNTLHTELNAKFAQTV